VKSWPGNLKCGTRGGIFLSEGSFLGKEKSRTVRGYSVYDINTYVWQSQERGNNGGEGRGSLFWMWGLSCGVQALFG